ncbi:MAG: hypothetical protein PHU85_16300 [Phycisphaerae bacterium]|nr:hypothetical protein [Phycisphaerae bacterium]
MIPTFFFGPLTAVKQLPNGTSSASCPVWSGRGRSIFAGVRSSRGRAGGRGCGRKQSAEWFDVNNSDETLKPSSQVSILQAVKKVTRERDETFSNLAIRICKHYTYGRFHAGVKVSMTAVRLQWTNETLQHCDLATLLVSVYMTNSYQGRNET